MAPWCDQGDLNTHALARTAFSGLTVYLFRHGRELVNPRRIERRTDGLRGRRSTTELRVHKRRTVAPYGLLVNRRGTAPRPHGLKGQRLTFRLAVQRLGPRFQPHGIANDDVAGLRNVVNPLPLHLHRLIADRAEGADVPLGCPLWELRQRRIDGIKSHVVLPGVGSPIRNRTCVRRLSSAGSATEL